ncbi:hypothetical protein PtA15_4A196 [Puccinia triticina]|uniref:Uncharacterized protein n=1 Tax=Puccinia triticina TaxID=208348 RepID=A0ABY7CFS3_9BASI|nr:uncharacterized protein PtA15_4A196 [Puccinia triticina]WAQ83748.1 hypothetical protein PtA15_4A196 [Puccinia triticina]
MPKGSGQRPEKPPFNSNNPKATPRQLVNFINLRTAPGEESGFDVNTPRDVLQRAAARLCESRGTDDVGTSQMMQQGTAPLKPRLKLVLRREHPDEEGPESIPASVRQTEGTNETGPISSPLSSVHEDEGTSPEKEKGNMDLGRGNGAGNRKEVHFNETGRRSNVGRLDPVASTSNNRTSAKRRQMEDGLETAATGPRRDSPKRKKLPPKPIGCVQFAPVILSETAPTAAGRNSPKRKKQPPKPIGRVQIAPLISPTGIESLEESLPSQEPMIWFEPDQPLESSSPGLTSSWVPLKPTPRRIPSPTNEKVPEAVDPFVEAELGEIESLRLKNNKPADDTLSQTVMQVMRTLQVGLLSSGWQNLCDPQGVDESNSSNPDERDLVREDQPTHVFLDKLVQRGLIVRSAPPQSDQAGLRIRQVQLGPLSSIEKPMAMGAIESSVPVDTLIIFSPPLSNTTHAMEGNDHCQPEERVAQQMTSSTFASSNDVDSSLECESKLSETSTCRLSLPRSRPPVDKNNSDPNQMYPDNVEKNDSTIRNHDFAEVYKYAYQAYRKVKPIKCFGSTRAAEVHETVTTLAPAEDSQNLIEIGPQSSASASIIPDLYGKLSVAPHSLASADIMPMDLDRKFTVGPQSSASALFPPMDLDRTSSVAPHSPSPANFISGDLHRELTGPGATP